MWQTAQRGISMDLRTLPDIFQEEEMKLSEKDKEFIADQVRTAIQALKPHGWMRFLRRVRDSSRSALAATLVIFGLTKWTERVEVRTHTDRCSAG
jgi:hypothetical protein